MNWYLTGLRKYATFDGRARRAEYWMYTLCNLVVTMLLYGLLVTVSIAGQGDLGALQIALVVAVFGYALGTALPSVAVVVRRLHDTGRSGWYYFISAIPLVGPILLIVWCCEEGTRAERVRPGPEGAGRTRC